MTRTKLIMSSLLFGACGVGEYGTTPNMTTDGSMTTGDRNLCATKGTPTPAYMHAAAGGAAAGTRAGTGCITAGCHIAGGPTSNFAFAGTVYKDVNGTTPQPGVVVRIFAGSGDTMTSVAKAVTDDAGNFAIRQLPGMEFNAFPYSTDVTACGTDAVAKGIRPMISPIAKADANCNAGGSCHVVPKVTGTPVYLLD